MRKGMRREVDITARRPRRRALCGCTGVPRLLLALTLSAACAGLADAGAAAGPAAAGVTAITDVRIIDGNGGTPVEHGTLLIEGDRIAAAGPATLVRVPSGARRIEGHGRSALPGLADMHVHLLGGVDGVGLDMLGYQKYLNALLYAGVTTVMDTGNVEPFVLQLRAEVAAGRVLGPRIYCVGPILDGAEPVWPALSIAITSKDQVPRIVAGLAADEKVDFIKLYVGLSDMLIRTISTEADRHGLRTIIDQWSRNGSADIAAEGIAGFAHFPSTPDRRRDHRHDQGAPRLPDLHARRAGVRSGPALVRILSFLDNPLIADTTPQRGARRGCGKSMAASTAEQLAAKSGYTMKVDLKGAESNVPRLRDAACFCGGHRRRLSRGFPGRRLAPGARASGRVRPQPARGADRGDPQRRDDRSRRARVGHPRARDAGRHHPHRRQAR